MRSTMASTKVVVLPVPGPASTSSGPPGWSTTRCWAASSAGRLRRPVGAHELVARPSPGGRIVERSSPHQPNTSDRQPGSAGSRVSRRTTQRPYSVVRAAQAARRLRAASRPPSGPPARRAQRCALAEVLLVCLVGTLLGGNDPSARTTRHQGTRPPCCRHHLAHLTRSSDPEVARDGAVRRHPSGWHAFDDRQDVLDVLLPVHGSPTARTPDRAHWAGLGGPSHGGKPCTGAPKNPSSATLRELLGTGTPIDARRRLRRRPLPHQEEVLGTRTNTGTALPPREEARAP